MRITIVARIARDFMQENPIIFNLFKGLKEHNFFSLCADGWLKFFKIIQVVLANFFEDIKHFRLKQSFFTKLSFLSL